MCLADHIAALISGHHDHEIGAGCATHVSYSRALSTKKRAGRAAANSRHSDDAFSPRANWIRAHSATSRRGKRSTDTLLGIWRTQKPGGRISAVYSHSGKYPG